MDGKRVQQHKLNASDWQASAEKVLQEIGAADLKGPPGMAIALARLANLLDRAPLDYLQRHGTTGEAGFVREQSAAQARLIKDDHRVIFSNLPAELLVRVAAQIAALDAIHHELAGIEAPADPNKDWMVSTDSGDIFLIPRRRLYRLPSRSPSGVRDLSRPRDLMPYHRILPTSVEGFNVRLTWRDLAAAWPSELKLGGVVFPELRFQLEETAGTFLVTDVICPGQDSQVATYLKSAHTEQCAAAVFPELTIDLEARDKLRKHLQGRLLWAEEKPGSWPSLVVAGSWHEVDGEDTVNVATVFDAYGEHVLRHEKMLAYRDPHGRVERIRPGNYYQCISY
jgi:hypothetical protein